MWLSAIKLAVNGSSHIYKKKKETQMRMADAQMLVLDGQVDRILENY